MLSPDQRANLIESLAPPPGHVLDLAVGTTYSLNLDALLTAPAAFALFRAGGGDDGLVPVEIIDSIRRHADRITLFHQAGQVSVPKTRLLFGLIEAMVVPARAPLGGIFHPKVWVLRYRDEHDSQPRYRVLCSSRNLTHDTSWDTMLRLDSTTQGRRAAPLPGLGDFVRALPGMATTPFDPERRRAIETLADELETVSFALPERVDAARFYPMGLQAEAEDPLPTEADSMLVVSPFVGVGKARNLAKRAERSILVSRAEEIERLGRSLDGYDDVYALDPDAHPSVMAQGEGTASAHAERHASFDDPDCALQGLHAKLYVFDQGRRTRLFTGSANATRAGFTSNVEVLIELEGKSRHLGVDAILGKDEDSDAPSFIQLLYAPQRSNADPQSEDETTASLDRLRHQLAGLELRGEIEALDLDGDDDRYRVCYRTTGEPLDLEGARLVLWPITLGEAHAVEVPGGAPLDARFTLSCEGLTRFVACELTLDDAVTRFVWCAELVGEPEGRRARLVRALLKDSDRVVRYLLMLLMDRPDERFDAQAVLAAFEPQGETQRHTPTAPLLEALLRTLRREPARLRQLHGFIESLARDDATDLLPPEFHDVWTPIWTLAQELER